MNTQFQPSRQRPVNQTIKQNLHPNQAFRKAAKTLLTDECFKQIEELANHMANPNTGVSA